MSVRVVFEDGSAGTGTALTGAILTAEGATPLAPGTPVRLAASLPAGDVPLEGRTIGSKRLPPGAYEVRIRLVNLRRGAREGLSAALAGR